jgi:glucose-6-phosphate isomerase
MSSFVSAWAGVEDAAHLAVTASGDAAESALAHVPELVEAGLASKIAAKDPTLWGPDAVQESSRRLGWVSLDTTSREFLPRLKDFAAKTREGGKTRVVLCGMGGSSLGPEVIARTHEVPLVVLDSTDPAQVRAALSGNLASTVVVVSSKSGSTVETDSQKRAFEEAFKEVGLDPAEHMVIVTDPGSPLEASSTEAGYTVFLADPNVGGRFSVLSAFGIVPAALAGVDVEGLLDEASAVADSLGEDSEANPALVLGAAMATKDHPTLVFRDFGSGIVGLGDWAEQLIAESTGKSGVGILPVVVGDGQEAPELKANGTLDVRLVSLEGEPGDGDITVAGTLGAQFLVWEYATAVAAKILGIGPFDQPDVESAKAAARAMLDAPPSPEPPAFTDGGIEVRATPGLLDGVTTVEEAVAALESTLGPQGYLAVMAYLDRGGDASLADVRSSIAARVGRPVTFGWGPRFLHSTGQLHKGGQPVGVFLQITGTFAEDVDIPGRPFTFGELISAQAAGDAKVLAEHGRPVLRLTLTRPEDLDRVIRVLKA